MLAAPVKLWKPVSSFGTQFRVPSFKIRVPGCPVLAFFWLGRGFCFSLTTDNWLLTTVSGCPVLAFFWLGRGFSLVDAKCPTLSPKAGEKDGAPMSEKSGQAERVGHPPCIYAWPGHSAIETWDRPPSMGYDNVPAIAELKEKQ